jgi:glycosyltransferase involved in cell wall biosynthesis
MLVAEGAQAQARAILQVLTNDLLKSQLASAGRAYVEAQHDWNKIAAQLEGIYRNMYES